MVAVKTSCQAAISTKTFWDLRFSGNIGIVSLQIFHLGEIGGGLNLGLKMAKFERKNFKIRVPVGYLDGQEPPTGTPHVVQLVLRELQHGLEWRGDSWSEIDGGALLQHRHWMAKSWCENFYFIFSMFCSREYLKGIPIVLSTPSNTLSCKIWPPSKHYQIGTQSCHEVRSATILCINSLVISFIMFYIHINLLKQVNLWIIY
jgi:hypothetical protein